MTTQTTERLEHVYRPVGSARELFHCRANEVLLSGAAGTGKSRACLEKLHAVALKYPGMRGLICRKTATSLGSTALVTFREFVAKEALASGEMKFYGGSQQEAAAYRYANGSVIVVGGMDKASRIMSSEYDVIYVQEATELVEDDWEALTTRLRNGKMSYQQLTADCNPGPPQHWLNQRCMRGACVMVPCRHEDNPRLFDGTGWTAEGQAYIARARSADRRPLPAAAQRHCGRLPRASSTTGSTRPFTSPRPSSTRRTTGHGTCRLTSATATRSRAQWWAQDHDGRLYLYKEIYMTGRLVEDHAQTILKPT